MTPEEFVLEHYGEPYHRHIPPVVTGSFFLVMGRAKNELCNDWIQCWIRISTEKRIIGIWWEGEGCCFSQAGASMIVEHLEGKTLTEAKAFTQDEMLELFRVNVYPERIGCVMVSFDAIQNALEKMPYE